MTTTLFVMLHTPHILTVLTYAVCLQTTDTAHLEHLDKQTPAKAVLFASAQYAVEHVVRLRSTAAVLSAFLLKVIDCSKKRSPMMLWYRLQT